MDHFVADGESIYSVNEYVRFGEAVAPSEFGLMAMALVVINFSLIRDLGTSAAIIQHNELKDSTTNAIFGLNITMGTVIAIVIALFSPLIATAFKEPRLTDILLLLSISFPIASSGSTHLALLERNSKFMIVSLIELSAGILALIAAIILGLYGRRRLQSGVFKPADGDHLNQPALDEKRVAS